MVLLDRSRKPVIATDAGEVVIRQAREAIKSFKMVRESVADLRGEISGVLRLGVIPTIAPYLLHRFVPGFARDYPNVELQIRELMTADIIRALGRDMLDAAILAGGTSPDGIQEEELFNDRFYAYVSTGHPLFERSNIRIEDIDVRRLLLLSEGNCLRDQVLELCQAQKGVQRRYSFESGSLETLIRIVDNSSNMVTIVPEMVADHRRKPQAPAQDAGQGATSLQDYDCRTAHLCKAFAGGCSKNRFCRMPSRPSCLAGYLLKLPPRGDSRFAVSVPLRSGAKGGSVSCPVSYLSTFYYLYPLETKRYDL